MTQKKFWQWFVDPIGNLITDRGRFSLLQVDEVDRLPIKDKLPSWLKDEIRFKELEKLNGIEKPEILRPETFWEKLQRKSKPIISLLVGILDLFTKGSATKIQNSIYEIFTDEPAEINFTNKSESSAMGKTIKDFIVGFVARWILKIGGGFLLSVGVSEGSVTEIVAAVCSILIGIAVSMFQQKKALEVDPKTLQR